MVAGISTSAVLAWLNSQRIKRNDKIEKFKGRYSDEVRAELEKEFQKNHYPSTSKTEEIAKKVNLPRKSVKDWFATERSKRGKIDWTRSESIFNKKSINLKNRRK